MAKLGSKLRCPTSVTAGRAPPPHTHADIYIMCVLTYVLREIVEVVWEQFTGERAFSTVLHPPVAPPPPSNSWLRCTVLPLKMTLLSLSQQGLHFMHILV